MVASKQIPLGYLTLLTSSINIEGKFAKEEGSPVFFTKEEGICTGTTVNGPIVADSCVGDLLKLFVIVARWLH